MSTVSLNNGYFSSMFKIVHENGIELRKPRKISSEHRQKVDSWPGKIDTAAKILRRKGIISVDLTFKGKTPTHSLHVFRGIKVILTESSVANWIGGGTYLMKDKLSRP